MASDETDQSIPGTDELLEAGIAAARAGNDGWARDLLLRAVELDAGNVEAWLWLGKVLDSPAEQRLCLDKVLSLEPDHAGALERLARLDGPGRTGGVDARGEEPLPSDPFLADLPPADWESDEFQSEDEDSPELALSDSRAVEWEPAEIAAAEFHSAEPVIASADDRSEAAGAAPGGLDGERFASTRQGTAAPTASPGVEVVLDAAPSPEVDDLMREGIAAARSQQPERARDLLGRVTQVDEKHVSAWLWLSYVAETAEEQARYVQKVISLAVADAAPRPAMAGALAGAGAGFALAGAAAPARSPSRSAAPGISLPSEIVESLRTAYAEWTSAWALTAMGYMAAIIVAELLTTFVEARAGLAVNALMMLALFAHAAVVDSKTERAFLVSVAFAPLIRILSLSLPLADIPILYWYLITSIPLFAALLVTAPVLGYSWIDLGLNLRRWPLQLAIGLTGIVFGAVEYLILQPDPLAPSLQLVHLWWPSLILLISTGLLEEMIFRGLLQRSAGTYMRYGAIIYVALMFAVLHIGYKSWADFFFVLLVGFFFGDVVQRTRSLVGVTLSHGLTNIVLFLVMPFLGWP